MNLTYGDIAFVVWVVLFSLLSLLCLAAQFVIKGMAKRSIRDASHSVRSLLSDLAKSHFLRFIASLCIFFILMILTQSCF
jgi:hypothetical protein